MSKAHVLTQHRWRSAGLRTLLALALSVALSVVFFACGSEDRTRANLPPRVAFFGSPVEGDSVNYVVDFTWMGWDDDGAVVRFEYAVDIPETFTPEQINDPATPGIEWITTPTGHARLRFRVNPDTADALAGTYPTDRASAPHTFFVRAYDNAGAHSPVAERSFNAWTNLPVTTITAPATDNRPYFVVNSCFTVRWTGEDPDGPGPAHLPVRTQYKLIKVPGVINADANRQINFDPGPRFPWVDAPADTPTVTVFPDGPGAYILALRSIDEAGGVESRFEFGRNAVLMQSSSAPWVGRPMLTVDEPLLGRVVFPTDGSVVDFELIAGQCLDFQLTGEAESYGGVVQDYRWCVDAAESPAGAGEVEGCVSWGPTRHLPPICLDTPGLHTFSFALRSTGAGGGCGGSEGNAAYTSGTLRINVLPRLFDREVLYVDDYFKPRDAGAPNVSDASIDQRFLDALHAAGFTEVDSYDAWGADDLEGAVTPITLEKLSRYRLVFWSVLGAGGGSQNGNTALLQAGSCAGGRILRAYVAAGGALWINGERAFGALQDRSGGLGTCLGTTTYSPEVGLSFAPGSFVSDFLHISGGDFRDATSSNTILHGLVRAYPTARARTEGYPTLEADSTTFAYVALGGLPLYDAMFQPTFSGGGGLDSLYTAEAVKPSSAFNGKPIAWRYADPNATPRQGAVAMTSFPLHRMKIGAVSHDVGGVRIPGTGVHGLVEVMGAWFRAHDATRGAMARPGLVGPASRVRPRYAGRAASR